MAQFVTLLPWSQNGFVALIISATVFPRVPSKGSVRYNLPIIKQKHKVKGHFFPTPKSINLICWKTMLNSVKRGSGNVRGKSWYFIPMLALGLIPRINTNDNIGCHTNRAVILLMRRKTGGYPKSLLQRHFIWKYTRYIFPKGVQSEGCPIATLLAEWMVTLTETWNGSPGYEYIW